jgi:flagellar motility protein MotE (MotC chaperone)
MKRSIPMAAVAVLIGALGGYGVSVAQGAPDDGPLSVRATADQGENKLFSLLIQKENALERREKLVANEEQDLRAAELALESRLLELQKLRDQIREMLTDLDGDREERVASLVKMFESMRPKQSAAILEVTDEEVALEVLERMNQGKAGKTLAAMEPTIAARLAERIGRAALTPPEEG